MANTAPAARESHVGAAVSSQQAAVSQEERPNAFAVYPGRVIRIDPVARKMSVRILNGYQIDGCIFAADSLAAILGFNQTAIPAIGSHVLVVYTPNQSYVISGVGAGIIDNPTTFSVPATGDINFEVINDPAYGVRRSESDLAIAGGYTPGKDVLPGEKEYSNNMGVWLRLLINMAQLSAGELAKVEVGLMNDMVRIVDNYFAHHNVGGDTLIWAAGGKCVEEEHFTGYGFEAEGKEDEHSELVSSKSNVVDPSKIEDPTNATGRWRKSTYVGFLGDMIHTWVSDPTKALSNYAKGAERAGKYRCWVGADGMLMVQSVGGIHLQVSPCVVIPEVNHNWNDPEFDIEKAFENLDKSFLKLWGNGTDGWRDLSVACWQMSSWARYITLWHSLERWNALSSSGYCKVPGEDEVSEQPAPTAKEKDKEEINPGGDTPYSGSAILSIDPSGTISLVANGTKEFPGTTSVIMNQGNLQLAAPGNIDIQCGGTLSMTAKNVSMKATDHIEIASIAGALWLKARSAWNALCEAGRMWLKSDFTGEPEEDYPVDGATPPYPQEYGNYAICVDAAEGKLALHGKNELIAATSGQEAPLYITTSMPHSPINIHSEDMLNVKVNLGTSIDSGTYMGCYASAVLIDCLAAKISDNVLVTPVSLEVDGLVRTNQTTAINGFMGPQMYVGVPREQDMDTINPAKWVDKADAETFTAIKEIVSTTGERTPNPTVSEVWTAYMWRFNDWYVGDGQPYEWTTYKQPLMIFEAAVDQGDGPASTLCEVDWSGCGLKSKSQTTDSESYPWPGKDCVIWRFSESFQPTFHEQAAVDDGDPELGGISKMEEIDYNFYVQQN